MKTYKVQFVNFDLGRGAIIGHVCGISGKSYLMSRYRNERHEAELITLERYGEIIRDVSGAWHLPMRRWIPMFVEVEENETGAAGVKDEPQAPLSSREAADSSPSLEKLPVVELRKLAAAKCRERKLDAATRYFKRGELLEFLKAA